MRLQKWTWWTWPPPSCYILVGGDRAQARKQTEKTALHSGGLWMREKNQCRAFEGRNLQKYCYSLTCPEANSFVPDTDSMGPRSSFGVEDIVERWLPGMCPRRRMNTGPFLPTTPRLPSPALFSGYLKVSIFVPWVLPTMMLSLEPAPEQQASPQWAASSQLLRHDNLHYF